MRLNFSHSIAPRIRSINCEWNQILERDVNCSAELAVLVQMFYNGLGKALRRHFLCQHDSQAERTQKVDGKKSNRELGTEEL